MVRSLVFLIGIAACFLVVLGQQNEEGLCKLECSKEKAPVCGSDGITYDNECELLRAACFLPELNITKMHDGECGIDEAIAAIVGAVSGKNISMEFIPAEEVNVTLECELCDPIELIMGPMVCGTNNRTYAAECELNVERCVMGVSEDELSVAHIGPCDICAFANRFTKWPFCPEILRPVCGTDGITYPNLCSLEGTACRLGLDVRVDHEGACTGCPVLTCGDLGTDRPVCGSDGITYENECALIRRACWVDESVWPPVYHDDIVVEHEGECEMMEAS